MVKTTVWCIMISILFFLSCVILFYGSITGNTQMIDNSFRGLVILGFLRTFSVLNSLNRR